MLCGIVQGGSGELCTLIDAEILAQVAQREQARAGKDWELADRIRDEMRAKGVEVHDREKTWRTNNGRRGIIGSNAISQMNTNGAYSGGVQMTDDEITSLVTQREKARQARDYTTADQIREQLQSQGVKLFDKEKVWRRDHGRKTYAY